MHSMLPEPANVGQTVDFFDKSQTLFAVLLIIFGTVMLALCIRMWVPFFPESVDVTEHRPYFWVFEKVHNQANVYRVNPHRGIICLQNDNS